MLYGSKYVLKYLLGMDIAGRSLAIYPDDTFIVSYPRSGNTWTRFLIASLLFPEESVRFSNIERLIPDATVLSSRTLKRVPRPRYIKTHEYFDPQYRKVIYLVRDPRDVAVSLYRFRRKSGLFEDDYSIERYVTERFLPGDLDVSWAEHVGSWLGARKCHPGFLLVRYEDLQQNTAVEVRRIAEFLGVQTTGGAIELAIERSMADRMRNLEKAEHGQWITTRGARQDIPFIGAAKVGGWTDALPRPVAALIESQWSEAMENVGYSTSCSCFQPQK